MLYQLSYASSFFYSIARSFDPPYRAGGSGRIYLARVA